jgi:hypothetical protein
VAFPSIKLAPELLVATGILVSKMPMKTQKIIASALVQVFVSFLGVSKKVDKFYRFF